VTPEQAARYSAGGDDNRRDAGAFARQNLVAGEGAAVGQGGDPLAARGLLCLRRHGRKLVAVVPWLITSWAPIRWCWQMVLGATAICTLSPTVAVPLPPQPTLPGPISRSARGGQPSLLKPLARLYAPGAHCRRHDKIAATTLGKTGGE
jgi:hypothetical protein